MNYIVKIKRITLILFVSFGFVSRLLLIVGVDCTNEHMENTEPLAIIVNNLNNKMYSNIYLNKPIEKMIMNIFFLINSNI